MLPEVMDFTEVNLTHSACHRSLPGKIYSLKYDNPFDLILPGTVSNGMMDMIEIRVITCAIHRHAVAIFSSLSSISRRRWRSYCAQFSPNCRKCFPSKMGNILPVSGSVKMIIWARKDPIRRNEHVGHSTPALMQRLNSHAQMGTHRWF